MITSVIFSGSTQRLMGYENTMGRIAIGDRTVKVDAFPMGIDYKKYSESSQLKKVRSQIDGLPPAN